MAARRAFARKMNGEKEWIMDTRIYVVTHKQIQLPEHEGYVPMVVGNHSVSYQNGVHDNTGENIADKNGNYCELTALYWMWKNLPNEGRYGLCHYRRFFTTNWSMAKIHWTLTALTGTLKSMISSFHRRLTGWEKR